MHTKQLLLLTFYVSFSQHFIFIWCSSLTFLEGSYIVVLRIHGKVLVVKFVHYSVHLSLICICSFMCVCAFCIL